MDGREARARSWNDALRARGVAVPLERTRPLIGLPADELLPRLTGIPLDSPLGRRIDAARSLLFRLDHLPNLRPFPRVRELLERMRAQGLKLAAVSPGRRADLEKLLHLSGGKDLIDVVIAAEDAPGSDPLEAAVAALHAEASRTMLIAGTPHDLSAATRQGMPAIALRCAGWDDDALAAAVAVYADPADLLERFESSPLADGPDRADRAHGA